MVPRKKTAKQSLFGGNYEARAKPTSKNVVNSKWRVVNPVGIG